MTPTIEAPSFGYVGADVARRKDDTFPAPPMRDVLASCLLTMSRAEGPIPEHLRSTLQLAASTLTRDEQTNAEMIDVLIKAGYHDVPARIDATMIRRLLGYITPK